MSAALAPTLRIGPAPAAVLGGGVATPARRVETAALLEALAPEIPGPRREALRAWVDETLGVRTRAHVAAGGRAWRLAVEAADAALAEAGRPAVVAHLHATSTPSRWTGADAARIGRDLGLRVAHVDLRGGCTGGLWALVEAARLCRDAGGPVLLTAADALSLTFPSGTEGDRLLPLVVGDGAAALVLGPAAAGGLVRAVVGGDPAWCDVGTVARELPDGDGPWTLGGDPAAFGEATRAGLSSAVAALDAPPDARWALHARADVARALVEDPFLDTLTTRGMLGVASLPTALLALRAGGHRGPIALATAGGGLGYGAALWGLG